MIFEFMCRVNRFDSVFVVNWYCVCVAIYNSAFGKKKIDHFGFEKGLELQSSVCLVCNSGMGSSEYVFLTCEVAANVWKLVQRWCDVPLPNYVLISEWLSWINDTNLNKDKKERLEVVV
ncbi:hypothetical protein LXL04_001650 [Taraxacum kok-saghyz]